MLSGTLQGLSIAKTAESLSGSKPTIPRELKGNSVNESHSPAVADGKHKLRRRNRKMDKKLSDAALRGFVADKLLNRQRPPEEISGKVKAETGDGKLSCHTICRGIKDGIFNKCRREDGRLKASRKPRRKGRKRRKKGMNDDIGEGGKPSETRLEQAAA